MSTHIEISPGEPTILMTRVYDAPRPLVWTVTTEPEHVRQWWGGPGVVNPICEMDVRPGGRWHHVMRFPNGHELSLDFVFLEVDEPTRLVWEHAERGKRTGGPPACRTVVTLEKLGSRTRWTMVARFDSLAERDAAVGIGFTGPIEASSEGLVVYLEQVEGAHP